MKKPALMTLDQATQFIIDCLHKTAPTEEKGLPLIRTPNIGRGRFNLNGVQRISQETYDKWTIRAIPQRNDLILAREAPAGNVAIIKSDESYCLGQRTVHIRANTDYVDPDFLTYFMLAPKQQAELLKNQVGVHVGHVNMRDIRRLPLEKLPTIEEQKKLASILTAYDDLIENNRRRIQLLEESARLLYKEWFVYLRFPGHEHVKIKNGVPEKWTTTPLGEKVTLKYGKALKAENRIEGRFSVFGSSGIVGTHEKFLVEGPGIVVGRKGNVGSVFLSPNAFWPIDTVYYISSDQANYYLYHAMQNMNFLSSDSAVPGLNRDYAYSRKYLLASASLREQFEEIVSSFYDQIFKLEIQNEKLRQARDLLLPRLMNGEIAV